MPSAARITRKPAHTSLITLDSVPGMEQSANRRRFVRDTATAAAGALFAGAPALAASRFGANDRIRVAVIGLRGRGRSHIRAISELQQKANVELAAFCDIDENVMAERLDQYVRDTGRKAPAHYVDMREVFDRPDIDAVFFATPNHWHSLGTIWACQAGKDVYVEKPLSHNAFEGRIAVKAARKYGRVVQHGTQNRSSPQIIEAVERLREGVIGEVYMARGLAYKWRRSIGRHEEGPIPEGVHYDLWKGPAPDRPFSNLRLHNKWHWQWDYGNGELGNQGVHQLDIMRWALDLGVPTRVQSMGGNFVHDDDQETPNVQQALYEYEGRKLNLTFEIRPWISNVEAGIGEEWPTHGVCTGLIFYGSEGYMVLPHYAAYYTYLGKQKTKGPFAEDPNDKIKDQPHFDNFIQAMRDRKGLTADVEQGHKSSLMAHLANISYRVGRQVRFDEASEEIVGDAEANALLTRTYRAPYVVSEKV